MAELIRGAFAKALDRNRDYFNSGFVRARRMSRQLDAEEFSDHLRKVVAPMVDEIARQAPEKANSVAIVLYDLSLELFAKDCLGTKSRYPAMAKVWQELFPQIPSFVAEQPHQLVSACCNAVYNLSVEAGNGGKTAEHWLARMKAIARLCVDVEQFLLVGQVLAWRSGMAHYRETAIAIWQQLPESLMVATLGFPCELAPSKSELMAEIADPWRLPGMAGKQKLAIVGQLGGFRGFGGPFICPPAAIAIDGQLFVYDDEHCWSLHTDCFGAILQPYGSDLPDGKESQGRYKLSPNGTAIDEWVSVRFPSLKNSSSYASDRHTLVATLPHSHKVYTIASIPSR